MRFHLGSIPDEFTPDSSWRPIREPGPIVLQLFAVPIGLGVALLMGYGWHLVGVTISLRFESRHALHFLVALVLSFPALIVVHELLHAIVHPRFGRSPATVIGAWPRRLLFYAHYSGPLTRDRFLAVGAMPFLVISVLPLVVATSGVLPPALTFWAAWFSTWNAFFACGDYFCIAIILFQIPRAATVQNQSWRTFWRPIWCQRRLKNASHESPLLVSGSSAPVLRALDLPPAAVGDLALGVTRALRCKSSKSFNSTISSGCFCLASCGSSSALDGAYSATRRRERFSRTLHQSKSDLRSGLHQVAPTRRCSRDWEEHAIVCRSPTQKRRAIDLRLDVYPTPDKPEVEPGRSKKAPLSLRARSGFGVRSRQLCSSVPDSGGR